MLPNGLVLQLPGPGLRVPPQKQLSATPRRYHAGVERIVGPGRLQALVSLRFANNDNVTTRTAMTDLRVAWDHRKSAANKKKHGISFEEAQTVFYDDRALLLEDPDESNAEDRFILLGMSAALRILVVCHCYREEDSLIRIISARKADRFERQDYQERWSR